MELSDELANALLTLERMGEDLEETDRNKIEKAIKDLKTFFLEYEIEAEPKEDRSYFEEKSPSQGSASSGRSIDSRTKVKFLLKKCKELYDLIQKYDTPTEELLIKARGWKRKLARAVRPHQEVVRDMFNEGVLEDISTVFMNLTQNTNTLKIKDSKKAMAYYVLKNDILREKEKNICQKEEKGEKKMLKPLLKEGRHFETSCGVNVLKEKSLTEQSDEMSEYFYDEVLDEEVIPFKVLQELYANRDAHAADKTLQQIKKKVVQKRTESAGNLMTELCLSESELGDDWNLRDWLDNDDTKDVTDGKLTGASVHEKKFSSFLQTYVMRMKGRAFPKINLDRWSVDKFKSRKLIASPIVRKFRISGNLRRFYSHPTNYYGKEKRLHDETCEPGAKARSRREMKESLEEPDLSDMHMGAEYEKKDMEMKSYIDRLKRSRVENMERLEYSNRLSRCKGFYTGLTSVATIKVPQSKSDIVKERMLSYKDNRKVQLPPIFK